MTQIRPQEPPLTASRTADGEKLALGPSEPPLTASQHDQCDSVAVERLFYLACRPVSDVGEWPLSREPAGHGVVHRQIEFHAACGNPRLHPRDSGVRRRRVDVYATDDSISVVEDRVCKTDTSLKVVCVALQVSQILGDGEPADGRPSTIRKARSGADMVDARHPGTEIGLVVLGPEWLQAKAGPRQALRNDKVIRDERLSHTARLRPTRTLRAWTQPVRSGCARRGRIESSAESLAGPGPRPCPHRHRTQTQSGRGWQFDFSRPRDPCVPSGRGHEVRTRCRRPRRRTIGTGAG
jgi:hypothetical protein